MAGDTPEESRLILAGGDLPVSRILDQARARKPGSPGGLVVLAACTSDLTVADYDEALTLSSTFLAAGAIGVIGARWEVDDLFTALLMFMLHRHLVENPDQSPARALHAAQLWMLDPQREIPTEMPKSLAAQARRIAISSPFAWAAFTYNGQ
jgi:CHAT domain-containing protein